jgi:hypothetical protein
VEVVVLRRAVVRVVGTEDAESLARRCCVELLVSEDEWDDEVMYEDVTNREGFTPEFPWTGKTIGR